MILLSVDNLSKNFRTREGDTEILSGISFSLSAGEVIGVRGENGSGKTTLFNLIAGIEEPNSGTITLAKIENRVRLGFVFQNYSSTLLPWLTANDNIGIPLQLAGLSKPERNDRVRAVVSKLNFEALPLNNYPHQLSGGQKQKISIARALIHDPHILILDEPFANLDFQTSIELQDILHNINTADRTAVMVVSHNIDQTLFLADRVLLLGGHPSSILREMTVDLPRPRDRAILISKEFENLRNRILEFEYIALQKS